MAMSRLALASYEPIQPSQMDSKLAEESSRVLSKYIKSEETQLSISSKDKPSETITIPDSAFRLLIDILIHMGRGHAITLIPIHAELTTQQAADLLNVSRPFVIQLTDSNQLPCRKVGTHRRILFKDLMEYKKNIDIEREKILDQLVLEAQEMNIGYE